MILKPRRKPFIEIKHADFLMIKELPNLTDTTN